MLLVSSHPHDAFSIKRVALESHSGPWTCLPTSVYSLMQVWMEGLVYTEGVVRVVGDLGRLALVGQSPSHELGALSACMCLGL